MFLSNVSIKRPVFATMMMAALVVLGIVSFNRLAIDEYPDITYPIVIAQTTYPGASPEVMERDVSRPIAFDSSMKRRRSARVGQSRPSSPRARRRSLWVGTARRKNTRMSSCS